MIDTRNSSFLQAHLWLIGRVHAVAVGEPFQSNGKSNIATGFRSRYQQGKRIINTFPLYSRSDNVLNLEFAETSIKAELLNDTSVLSTCQTGIIFTLSTSHNHLSTGKDECRRLRFPNSHNHGGESLQKGGFKGREATRLFSIELIN